MNCFNLIRSAPDKSSRIEHSLEVDGCKDGFFCQPFQKVVWLSQFFDLTGGSLRMTTNQFVQNLPIAPRPDPSHQNFFRSHEWKL